MHCQKKVMALNILRPFLEVTGLPLELGELSNSNFTEPT